MTMKTVVNEFIYKDNSFVIVAVDNSYVAVNRKDIDENGRLTRTIAGGYETIEDAIRRAKYVVDYKEYVNAGYSKIDAAKKALGI